MVTERVDHLQKAYNGLCSVIHELKAGECFHFSARADLLREDLALLAFPSPPVSVGEDGGDHNGH